MDLLEFGVAYVTILSKETEELYLTFTGWGSDRPPQFLCYCKVGSRVCSEQPIICWKETPAKKKTPSVALVPFVRLGIPEAQVEDSSSSISCPGDHRDPNLPVSSPGTLILVHITTFYIKMMGSSLSMCCNHPNKNGSFA